MTDKEDRQRTQDRSRKELQNQRPKYQEFLKTSHFTQAGRQRTGQAPDAQHPDPETDRQKKRPTRTEPAAKSSDYYEAEKATQFTRRATRDVRIVVNKDQQKVEAAKAALEKDDSPKPAGKRSRRNTPKTRPRRAAAACRRASPKNSTPAKLGEAIFSAPKGRVEGPVEATRSAHRLRGRKVDAEEVQPARRSRKREIKSQLEQQSHRKVFTGFVDNFRSSNGVADLLRLGLHDRKTLRQLQGHAQAEGVDPACYGKRCKEADPKPRRRPKAARRRSLQLKPALPGTITIVAPRGLQLAAAAVPAPARIGRTPSLEGTIPSECRRRLRRLCVTRPTAAPLGQ